MCRFFVCLVLSLGLLGCQKSAVITPLDPNASAEMWSNSATWGGNLPNASSAVVIPSNKRIVLDTSAVVKNITVLGTLEFLDKNLELQADYIAVQGAMSIGSPINPFSSQLQITLTGNANENIMNMGSRGILVMGTLEIHGAPPATT
jgi:hypothetical protein